MILLNGVHRSVFGKICRDRYPTRSLIGACQYIGLEVVSNVEGASGDIAARLKFSEDLKPGEEVEV